MSEGTKHVNYPVKDLEAAKKLYGPLLGVDPYVDEAYYVGYRTGELEFGLDPYAHQLGMTGPVAFFNTTDIKQSIQTLIEAGAVSQQEPKDVGGGMLVAYLKDADGNSIGLIQAA